MYPASQKGMNFTKPKVLMSNIYTVTTITPQTSSEMVLCTMYVCRLTLSNKGDYQMYNNIVQKNFEVFATLQ